MTTLWDRVAKRKWTNFSKRRDRKKLKRNFVFLKVTIQFLYNCRLIHQDLSCTDASSNFVLYLIRKCITLSLFLWRMWFSYSQVINLPSLKKIDIHLAKKCILSVRPEDVSLSPQTLVRTTNDLILKQFSTSYFNFPIHICVLGLISSFPTKTSRVFLGPPFFVHASHTDFYSFKKYGLSSTNYKYF
jgi:hypothetical protein